MNPYKQELFINKKYLYYYLKNFQDKLFSLANDAIPKHLELEELKNFTINLPSLQIQNKIVEILDDFEKYINDISEGLPLEIELRQKQYEYYRNKLLSFDENK
ncbi:conserved hypothetical protein [Mycoplasmopsis alligatoris A21JP2]|uniref:Type I restriction modification DNA specificity domain-containing protein n=1 Tax=Mycoplasmopsis alligatoris A21JP2 TaxID=747682 RepID=D4XVA1_9BACT|nr:restriction endonuclease subunit S [Mycoplasmopsis alligatoris]EFF41727.1 conserved hypothetical protein [Mycoplasmopsis alligatoris A21JP2]